MPATPPYTESVFFLTLNFARRMRATLDKELSVIDVSVPEFVALMVLNSVGPLSNAALARRCSISPQAMMKVTARLTGAELIDRATEIEDRQHLLTLSPRGEQKVAEIVERLRHIVRGMTARTTPDEYREFKRLLAIYWEALGPVSLDPLEFERTDTEY